MTTTHGDSSAVTNEGGRALGSAYVVLERIGRGATGEVWRGIDRRTGSAVAIKILRSEFAEDPSIVERFLRERVVLARLDDPHIVRLRDLVVEGDTVALVTDLVVGGDLRARLRRDGPLSPAQAIDVTCQVLTGLETAHRHGIIHRDLKPENVLVTSVDDGLLVQVTDFGIATLAYSATTNATSLMGSPEYMAPEIVEQHHVTGAADVYGAGILLYELLTGGTPFVGGSPIAVLRRQVEDVPARIPGLPAELWAELAALLAKEPGARPRSAELAAERLRALEHGVAGLPALDSDGSDLVDIREDDEVPTYVPRATQQPELEVEPERTTHVGRSRPPDVAPRPVPTTVTTPRWWRWATLALLAVALAAALWLGFGRSGSAPRLEYTSAPVLQGGTDVVVTRHWTLSGAHADHVEVTLRIRNLGTTTVGRIDEPALTSNLLEQITVNLKPGQERSSTYRRDVPPGLLDVAHIKSLEQRVDVKTQPRLASVAADPQSLQLDEHERSFLNLSGTFTRGIPTPDQDAASELLAGIEWRSSDAGVADVTDTGRDLRPVVVAGHAGTATVSAQVGDQTLRVRVLVRPVRSKGGAGPCEPGTGDPPGLTTLADGTHVLGNASEQAFFIAGGARIHLVDHADLPPALQNLDYESIDESTLDAMSFLPRDGTVLDGTGSGAGKGLWLVVAGYRVPVRDPSDLRAPTTTPVQVPADGLYDIPVYDSHAFPRFAPRDGTLVRGADGTSTLLFHRGVWSRTANGCSAAHIATLPPGIGLPSPGAPAPFRPGGA